MHTKLFALVAVVGMLGMAVGPGVAAAAASDSGNDSLTVSVEQDDGVLVSVTNNDSGVDDASVNVTVDGNGSYAGTGTHATDENGTVVLESPEENVTIDVTASADNETANTTATLTVASQEETDSGAFGQTVSSFVQSLLDDGETGIGQQVAEFVTANNPGNAPDHAGPPEHAGDENESENETQGPPEHAGGPDDKGNDDKGNDDKGNDEKGGGPPAHADGGEKAE